MIDGARASNLKTTKLTDRTGKHTVADLQCAACGGDLGWMYIKAPNGDQRYKEGE